MTDRRLRPVEAGLLVLGLITAAWGVVFAVVAVVWPDAAGWSRSRWTSPRRCSGLRLCSPRVPMGCVEEGLLWASGVTGKRWAMRRAHAFRPGARRSLCRQRFADEVLVAAFGVPACASCARRAASMGLPGPRAGG